MRVDGKWNYVYLITDLYNQEILGYSAGPNKTVDLVHKPFSTIKYNLRDIQIFHTDRGNEFKNNAIEDLLNGFSINRSLSKKGCLFMSQPGITQ